MSVLRVYEPGECDEAGVPLDLERCRWCGGDGMVYTDKPGATSPYPCRRCAGHGSLKAAALAAVAEHYPAAGDTILLDGRFWTVVMTKRKPLTTPVGGLSVEGRYDRGWATLRCGDEEREVAIPDLPDQPARCEGCGHPMSDGTWEGDTESRTTAADEGHALWCLRTPVEPDHSTLRRATHWSPCDEGCHHGGPARAWMPEGYSHRAPSWEYHDDADSVARQDVRENGLGEMQASWRAVDVRAVDGPHDLRPEHLAVLCLRCWAERSTTTCG